MKSRLHAHIGTLRQLEIFLAVYDLGSIKAASETLHLTQPTVSMQTKKLADAMVGWNGGRVVDALTGNFNGRETKDGEVCAPIPFKRVVCQ